MSPMTHEVIVAIPFTKGTGHSLEKVEVKYEWVPSRCEVCKIFDHIDDECPKKPNEMATTHVEDDGFTKVTKRNGKKKQNTVKQAGIRFSKPKVNIIYREVSKTADLGDKIIDPGDKGAIPNDPNIFKPSLKEVVTPNITACSNSFGVLDSNDDVVDNIENDNWKSVDCINESDSDVDELIMENENGTRHVINNLEGASTPVTNVFNGADGILKKLDRVLDRVQTDLDQDTNNISLRDEEAAYVIAYSDALLLQERFLRQKAKIQWLKEGDSNSVNVWEVHVSGFLMYNVVKKLKNLKKPFRKLLHENGNIHKNVDVLCVELDRVQTDLDQDPNNISLRDEEAAYVIAYSDALLLQERILRRRSNGLRKVPKAFIDHYEVFLGQPGITQDLNIDELFGTKLDENDALNMIHNDAWDIVGDGIIAAVKEFFTNGRLLKELNHTDSLKTLISPNQSAFVPSRSIADSMLLTQELMHNYHLDRGVPRCAFKVNIQKAYDAVD
nr:hypothetical protein [Tanacetum cinerariifolium]